MKLNKSAYGWSALAILFLISSFGQVFGKPTPGETNRGGTIGASFALTLLFIFLAYRSTVKSKVNPVVNASIPPNGNVMNESVLEKKDLPKSAVALSTKEANLEVGESEGKVERKKISLVEQEEAKNRISQIEETVAAIQQSKDLCPVCHESRLLSDVAYCSKCGGKLN